MIRELLNPNNYALAFSFNVSGNKELIIPDEVSLSPTMLVRWRILNLARGEKIEFIPDADLAIGLEIVGMGKFKFSSYQLKPSIQGDEKVQLISLTPYLPYKMSISNVSNSVVNSIIEFYTSNIMGDFNNPVSVTTDLSPVIAAIASGSAAEVAAIQAQTAMQNRQVQNEAESEYTPTVWSNTPANHVAVPPDSRRIGGSFYNNGNKPLAIDKFLDIGTKTAAMQADGLLQPGGTYNFKPEEAAMGYLIYALTPGGSPKVAMNLQK
jgi:hypothetical protein